MTANQIQERYTVDQVKRFYAIVEAYAKNGNTRERLVERLELEFKEELKKQQIDELEKYHEWKRWQRQKEKALMREWAGKR